ncbi:MAG TPA: hypothetical protein ENJ46_04605 [Hellea balneolensis]|uniref:Uncharacterized protein n=1 Tax=Hellea balneolensis TaxID=287478 RepID=A0A7C3C9P9_9PROT|nr:hypothetical protein [Hellea balneolensis]
MSLEPLSAHHILFTAGNLPPDDPTKLVVYIPKTPFLIRARAGAYFDAQMWPGAGGNRLVDLPLKSVPPLQDFEHNDKTGGEFFVVPLFSATKDKEGQGANYASIILSKGNTKGGGDVNIRRWLLMPPKGLQWDAADRPDTILVKWEESELKKIAKHKEFVGYNIYRQEIVDGSDNKFTGGPLNEKPITETSYETPALRGRWKYSVTVVDILGNESAFSEPEPDPFAGEWEGALYLVNGDFSYILDEIQREDKEQDAEDRASYARAREFINLVQNFMRLGVPITFRIEKKHEKYAVTPIEFAYFNMEKETDEGILWFEQAGEYTLSSIEKLQDGTPVKLSLKRKDEFDETYSHTYADGTHSLPLTLRIRLKRIEEGSRDPAERERKRKRLVKMFSGWAKRLEK